MRPPDDGQGALGYIAVVDVGADGQGAIVGVRPKLNVLVPLHFLAAPGPFEIQLGMMEFNVRPDQIGNHLR